MKIMSGSTVTEILADIQSKLKAPKGQTNNFGKYKYRSCEDIVEAVKPLLSEHGAALILYDEIVGVGDRCYVKATARLFIGKDNISTTAYAREPESKKGMDGSQITGAASSYARKYALNGLFAIDDTKDADTQDNSQPEHRFKPGEKDQIVAQVNACLENGDEHGLKEIFSEYETTEEKMKVWALFNSQQRSAIKSLTSEAGQ